MHDIYSNFIKILETVKSLDLSLFDASGNVTRHGMKPQFSDIEVISLALTAEYMSLDSENWLFNKIKATRCAS